MGTNLLELVVVDTGSTVVVVAAAAPEAFILESKDWGISDVVVESTFMGEMVGKISVLTVAAATLSVEDFTTVRLVNDFVEIRLMLFTSVFEITDEILDSNEGEERGKCEDDDGRKEVDEGISYKDESKEVAGNSSISDVVEEC